MRSVNLCRSAVIESRVWRYTDRRLLYWTLESRLEFPLLNEELKEDRVSKNP